MLLGTFDWFYQNYTDTVLMDHLRDMWADFVHRRPPWKPWDVNVVVRLWIKSGKLYIKESLCS